MIQMNQPSDVFGLRAVGRCVQNLDRLLSYCLATRVGGIRAPN